MGGEDGLPKAKDYFEEALGILEKVKKTPVIEKQMKKIQKNLNQILRKQ